MDLSNIIAIPEENRKAYIDGLSDSEKLSLFQATQADCDAREKEYISNQSLLKKAQEDYDAEMAKLKELGINSVEELEQRIVALDDELVSKVVDYAKIISNGEGGV